MYQLMNVLLENRYCIKIESLFNKFTRYYKKMSIEKRILEDGVANFFSGKKEYRTLSNFWENDVAIVCNGIIRIYESGEHCFHGEKYFRLGEICEDEERKNVLLAYGQKFLKTSSTSITCAQAKKMGGKRGFLLNNAELQQWDHISIQVQKEICTWKMENYPEVRNDLAKSCNKILVHPALRCSEERLEKTRLWEGKGVIIDGKIRILGKNMLGKLWMDLR